MLDKAGQRGCGTSTYDNLGCELRRLLAMYVDMDEVELTGLDEEDSAPGLAVGGSHHKFVSTCKSHNSKQPRASDD